MSRIAMHLLAWLSVETLLFANAHTSSAVAALWHRPATPESDSQPRTCCGHCKARQAKPPTPPTNPTQQSVVVSAQDGDPSSCPCCPGPCPDNCVLCGVAKVPVTLAPTFDFVQTSLSIERWTDPIDLHLASFTGELMRPPRA